MPSGAILTFDQETDAAVRGLWQVLEDNGLPSTMPGLNYPPHLTFLVCNELDLDDLREHLPRVVAAQTPFLVDFAGLGVFSSLVPVLHLPVVKTPALTTFHASLWQLVAPFAKGLNPYYHPNAWMPHVTLNQGFPIEQAGAMVDALIRVKLPISGLLRNLVLVDFDPGLPVLKELFTARLGSYL